MTPQGAERLNPGVVDHVIALLDGRAQNVAHRPRSLPVSRTISLLGLLLLPAAALAQEGATVSGRVLDEADGAPIPLTSVVIARAESGDTLSGALTREDGRFFVVGLAPGRYIVHMSFPGLFPEQRELLVSEINPTYDLGDILLRNVIDLAGVTVTAEAIRTAGIDTDVYRLGEGPAQSTGSVLDALRSLPGVTVDEEGRVSLRGSDQVAVLIDGRQSSLTGFGSQRGLDNVPAANVAAIEIINNPSASLDAAGMAGVINIIYEQERALGFSADLGLSLGMGQFTKQRPDLPTELGSFSANEKITPSLALNYNTERARSFVQGEFLTQDDLPNNEFTTRFYEDGRVIRSQVPENREQTHSTGFANAALNWKHEFPAPGHELDINLQYTRGWEDEAYFLNEESSVRIGTDMTHLEAVENTLPLSVDYTRPLASGRIEVGGKIQARWLPITYAVDRGVQSVIYDGLGDESDWEEDSLRATSTWCARGPRTRWRPASASSRPTSRTRFPPRTSITRAATRTTTSSSFRT